jgi:hypothetical protein
MSTPEPLCHLSHGQSVRVLGSRRRTAKASRVPVAEKATEIAVNACNQRVYDDQQIVCIIHEGCKMPGSSALAVRSAGIF